MITVKDVSFPIEERKLVVEGIGELGDKKVIVRPDTNRVLGIVSNKYKVVRHNEVLNSVSTVLDDAGLKMQGLSLCRGGSVLFAKFFSDENGRYKQEVKVGDVVKFGLEIFNSYDGSMQVGACLIALRLKCTNGMVVPETISSFFIKHYDSLDLGDIRRKSLDILDGAGKFLERWQRWSKIEIENKVAKGFFDCVFGNRYKKVLFERYSIEKEGNTVWDLYNFFTRWLTYEIKTKKGRGENRRLLQWDRERKITGRLVSWVKNENIR